MDVVDVSTWAGDSKDPSFIAGQLRLLDMNIQDAKGALKGGTELELPWYKDQIDEKVGRMEIASAGLRQGLFQVQC
jgi:hypothetical protein